MNLQRPVLSLLLLAVAALVSHCTPPDRYRLTGSCVLRVSGMGIDSLHTTADSLKHPTFLEAELGTEQLALRPAPWNPIPTAKAFSPPEPVYVNEIDPRTIRLTLSKAILFDGDTLAAGTDLQHHPAQPLLMVIYYPRISWYTEVQRISWLPGDYTLQFSAQTTEGTQLQSSKSFYVYP